MKFFILFLIMDIIFQYAPSIRALINKYDPGLPLNENYDMEIFLRAGIETLWKYHKGDWDLVSSTLKKELEAEVGITLIFNTIYYSNRFL